MPAPIPGCIADRLAAVIDFSGKIPFLTIRFRLGLLLAAAVAPFIVVLMIANFWVYQPLQQEVTLLSRDIETRFDGVARLQLTLTRSAMPVNDYLVHGHESERREYQMLLGQVEAAFALVRASLGVAGPQELEHVERLYGRWQHSVRLAEAILNTPREARYSPATAIAMETYDKQLDRLVDDAGELLDNVRNDLARSRDHLESRRDRMTWFVLLSAFLATMVTMSAIMYLSQRVIPPLARTLRDDGGDEETAEEHAEDDVEAAGRRR